MTSETTQTARTALTSYVLVALLFLVIVAGGYFVMFKGNKALVFSSPQMLSALWNNYKKVYITAGGARTIDPARDGATTSEGESYTMLRAVWMGDKATFDASWDWTRTTLQRPDGVYSWLYGKRTDGTYGILTDQGGVTSASDADVDIALSLIFAYARWQDPAYLAAASTTINGIWNTDVVRVQGTPYLSADSLEKESTTDWVIINPSYLNLAAFRIFAQIDPAHPWMQVVDSSYTILERTIDLPLDTSKSAGLPPDWIRINKKTGEIQAVSLPNTSTDFGYNALRIPWRLTLDWEWFHDSRDQAILDKFSFLSTTWKKDGFLYATYTHNGSVATSAAYQSPAMYGGTIGYFMIADPAHAADIYSKELEDLFSPDNNTWKGDLSYYDDNWAWFGIALYNHLLPNIAASLPSLSTEHSRPLLVTQNGS